MGKQNIVKGEMRKGNKDITNRIEQNTNRIQTSNKIPYNKIQRI